MIEADERGCFGHAVALYDNKAQPAPELFRLCIKSRAAHNERPEFQSKLSVNTAKLPPASRGVPTFRLFDLFSKATQLAFSFKIALQLVAQDFKNARDCGHYGDSLAADSLDYLRGVERVKEVNFRAQKWWNK